MDLGVLWPRRWRSKRRLLKGSKQWHHWVGCSWPNQLVSAKADGIGTSLNKHFTFKFKTSLVLLLCVSDVGGEGACVIAHPWRSGDNLVDSGLSICHVGTRFELRISLSGRYIYLLSYFLTFYKHSIFKGYLFFVWECLPTIYISHTIASFHSDQEMVLYPLDLELQVVVNCCIGADWTLVLCRNSKCFKPLSHLSSLYPQKGEGRHRH